jgi:hypothetical protein
MAIIRRLILICTFTCLGMFSAPSTALQTDDTNCQLNISSWHKGKPFLYREDNIQKGIYPDLFKEIFAASSCEVKVSFFPAGRVKAKGIQLSDDLTFLIRPYGSNLFTASPKYLVAKAREKKKHIPRTNYALVSTPAIYPSIAYIGSKEHEILANTPEQLSRLRFGAIHAPQKNLQYWKDFYGLKLFPQGFKTERQGLKAVAAGRIDAFVFFSASIQEFEQPDRLNIIKTLHPFELRLLIHERGLTKLTDSAIETINQRIEYLHKSGEVKRIIERHSDPAYFYFPH